MRAAAVALMLLAAGCAGSSRSIIDYPARVHIVQPGETLYGIAWRYGVDYRDLARWNRIDDPNFIRVGQRILLTPPASDITTVVCPPGPTSRMSRSETVELNVRLLNRTVTLVTVPVIPLIVIGDG